MAKRSTSAARAAKRSSVRSGPVALRSRFLRVAARKNIKHLREITATAPGSPQVSARSASGILNRVIDAIRLYLWCRDVEQALDHGTEFLAENWDKLSPKDRESLEQDLANLLNSYAESC